MKYEYSENVLVQDSAAALMKDELGWDVVYAYNKEILGENGTLGRKSYHEIVLWRFFNAALKRLNPWITDAQLAEARQILSSYTTGGSAADIELVHVIGITSADQRREILPDPGRDSGHGEEVEREERNKESQGDRFQQSWQQPLPGGQRAEDPRRHLPPPHGYCRFCERTPAAVRGA